ncbi:oligoribonuclease, mitochondrial isoform X2 [Eurytemora carolleeae]|uniref:oligoribonuclease, mitochondrial isoform X2 n=2 Tax=Eurytemora carolleeae TaxID=1294199 RepID=UPI000C7912AE|nr:oligoribonuclease, mitochondrial isoform X2 [Eurytemora carolleeae]|eukprot:XP_023335513.1 oligoribonuclease, mitochondrial-like isoform X2 [Eurytemora affinis]
MSTQSRVMSSSTQVRSRLGSEKRLIWVDCEMTGLDIKKDVIMEIAVVVTEGDTLEEVGRSESIIIQTAAGLLDEMDEWCTQHHGDSGLTAACLTSQITMRSAEDQVLQLLEKLTPKGKCPLAGNSVGEDKKFLEKCMPRVFSHLHYRIVDVSTIKELYARWKPITLSSAPRKMGTHRALDDILESIKELKYYKENFFKL